jgi:ribonuclease BN (tRNA processing enzyme)
MTVLGKSPAMPDANGANSGYLIRHDGFVLLLECGTGVFAKLRGVCDPPEVDAVLITHLHADHMLDLIPFSHALTYHNGDSKRRPRLCAPPGSTAMFDTLTSIFGQQRGIADVFVLTEYEPASELELGPFTVSFREVPHYIPTWACDLRQDDGRRFTFGADCAPNEAIVELARETDLLMLEATEGAGPHDGKGVMRGHMTAGEAGAIGRQAAAGRLLLTHYSDQLDAADLRAVAEAAYGAGVELAHEHAEYTV